MLVDQELNECTALKVRKKIIIKIFSYYKNVGKQTFDKSHTSYQQIK